MIASFLWHLFVQFCVAVKVFFWLCRFFALLAALDIMYCLQKKGNLCDDVSCLQTVFERVLKDFKKDKFVVAHCRDSYTYRYVIFTMLKLLLCCYERS